MDATATLGLWKKTTWLSAAFVALCVGVYFAPPAAFFFAFALPMLLCPAFAQGRAWVAMGFSLAPALGYLLGGGDPVYGTVLALVPSLCLLITYGKRRWHWDFITGVGWLVAVFLGGALGIAARLSDQLGGPLFSSLSQTAVDAAAGSPYVGNILYRLTSMGFLDVPDSYRTAAMLQVGDLVWINPPLQRELLNMLRLRLFENFSQWIPMLLMQGALLLGLFTALATERARVRQAPAGSQCPSFRKLKLSRREQGYMLFLCLGTAVTSFSQDAFWSLLCLLMYSAFAAVFQLTGASVFLDTLSRRRPQRLWLYGLLAAALYLLFPLALFLLGVIDQFIDLRQAGGSFPPSEP